MIVVIVCNVLKVIAVYCTLNQSATTHLVTQGDTVASFSAATRHDYTRLLYTWEEDHDPCSEEAGAREASPVDTQRSDLL